MSQYRGEVKKVHPVEWNNLAVEKWLHFFGEIDQNLNDKKLILVKTKNYKKRTTLTISQFFLLIGMVL